MDDDFEDLLGDGEELQDEEMIESQSSKALRTIETRPEVPVVTIPESVNLAAVPSGNEVRLGRRVLELEKERDEIASELATYKARFPFHSHSIPATASASATVDASTKPAAAAPIEIPHELLPVLAVLRQHIAVLTRDNQALRYTFLGQPDPSLRRRSATTVNAGSAKPSPSNATAQSVGATVLSPSAPSATSAPGQVTMAAAVASSSKTTLDVPMTPSLDANTASPHADHIGEASNLRRTAEVTGIDLEKVVDRVRELINENEELGEMVLEAGDRETEEWETALRESKEVVTSLDADLTHHASLVQTLRGELSVYQKRYSTLSTTGNADEGRRNENGPSTQSVSAPASEQTQGLSIRGAGGGSSWRPSSNTSGSRTGSDNGRAGPGGKRHGRESGGSVNSRGGGDRHTASSGHGQGQSQGNASRGGANGHGGGHGQGQGQGQDRPGSNSSRNDDRGSKRRR